MKLIKVKRSKCLIETETVEDTKAKKAEKKSKWTGEKLSDYSDEYADEFSDEFPVGEIKVLNLETGYDHVNQVLNISVRRLNEDVGLPHVWLLVKHESLNYRGFIKDVIHFPLSELDNVIQILTDIKEKAEERDLFFGLDEDFDE